MMQFTYDTVIIYEDLKESFDYAAIGSGASGSGAVTLTDMFLKTCEGRQVKECCPRTRYCAGAFLNIMHGYCVDPYFGICL